MINVTINKQESEIKENITVERLLKMRNTIGAAVWINGSQLLKSEYSSHVIKAGDEIKILRILAGG